MHVSLAAMGTGTNTSRKCVVMGAPQYSGNLAFKLFFAFELARRKIVPAEWRGFRRIGDRFEIQ